MLHLVFLFEVQFNKKVKLADEFKRQMGGGWNILSFGDAGELDHQVNEKRPQHTRLDIFFIGKLVVELLIELFHAELVFRLQMNKHGGLRTKEKEAIATYLGILVL